MGYYTNYSLSIGLLNAEGDKFIEFDDDSGIIEEFRKESDCAEWAIDEYGHTLESTKWYNWLEELKDFSKKHPYVIFLMEGEGEETKDVWKCYVHNNKYQLCKAVITFESININKFI